MRVDLPGELELTCPHCRGALEVRSRALHGCRELNCPFCENSFSIYDALPVQVRRKVYHALRDAVESEVYARYQRLHGDEPDPWKPKSQD